MGRGLRGWVSSISGGGPVSDSRFGCRGKGISMNGGRDVCCGDVCAGQGIVGDVNNVSMMSGNVAG